MSCLRGSGNSTAGNAAARVAALRAVLEIARNGKDDAIVKDAFEAVEEIGEESDIAVLVAIPPMAAYMSDNRNPLARRVLAIRAIGSIGEQRSHVDVVKESIVALTKALDSDKSDLVDNALWALGQIGEQAPELVKGSISAISRIAETHDREGTRVRASAVLREIESARRNIKK